VTLNSLIAIGDHLEKTVGILLKKKRSSKLLQLRLKREEEEKAKKEEERLMEEERQKQEKEEEEAARRRSESLGIPRIETPIKIDGIASSSSPSIPPFLSRFSSSYVDVFVCSYSDAIDAARVQRCRTVGTHGPNL